MPVSNALIIPIDDLSPADVQAILEFANTRLSQVSGAGETVAGWTSESATNFVLRLAGDPRGLVRVKAIFHAANNGGQIARETVYELGGYSSGRSLKGFTKPMRRHMAAMKAEGLLLNDATLPLAPVYDPDNASYQKTTGFRMPDGLDEVFSGIAPTA